jgi:hypothetical protein
MLGKIDEVRQTESPAIAVARDEIQRLRESAEAQVVNSQALIERLRGQLADTSNADDIDTAVDEQLLKIKNAEKELDIIIEEKYALEGEYRQLEAEVGPIKYIAEFVYGETADNNMLEEAVRWVIIIIIFVFDPLAVLMLIASQYTFHWVNGGSTGGGGRPKSDEDEPQDDPEFEDVSPEELAEEERRDYEQARAQAIADNVPPDFEKEEEPTKSEHSDQLLLFPDIDPEPVVPTKIETPEVVADPNQLEFDFTTKPSQEELNNEMIETDDLDKWNDWVEKANEEAEANPEITTLGEGEQGTRQIIGQKKTSYITKVENKQVRLKTQE